MNKDNVRRFFVYVAEKPDGNYTIWHNDVRKSPRNCYKEWICSPPMTKPDALYCKFRLSRLKPNELKDLLKWYAKMTRPRSQTLLDSDFMVKVGTYARLRNQAV